MMGSERCCKRAMQVCEHHLSLMSEHDLILFGDAVNVDFIL